MKTSSFFRATALDVTLVLALPLALLANGGLAAAELVASPDKVRALPQNQDVRILGSEILNRWEPIAVDAAMHSSAWRETFATQLSGMNALLLQTLDAVAVEPSASPAANYARFASAFRSVMMQSYMAARSGKGPVKLGSLTVDQVFIPITPCRIVDTRNLLGPIAAGSARNYDFYAASSGVNWSTTQGGSPGAAGTVCAGTVNPNGGPPSAAMVTITVVSPSAAGNLVMWGGGAPAPLVSVLNWNNPGDIAANTTVVPAGGRTGSGPGGPLRDFTVAYNGPSGQAQVVIDVVGYFVENRATPLECIDTVRATQVLAPNALGAVAVPACPTGYTMTSLTCFLSGSGLLNSVLTDVGTCWGVASPAAGGETLYGGAHCCRIPGR